MSNWSEPAWIDHCGDLWRRHVLATTGFDIETITGPSPRGPREWVATMRRLGVRDLSGVVSAVHGAPLASTLLARRGDIVRRGWALGICWGEMAKFYGGIGLPMCSDVDEAWSVQPGPFDKGKQ